MCNIIIYICTCTKRNKQDLVKLRFFTNAVAISWDEFVCPQSFGTSFPPLELPTFWSCISLPPHNPSAQCMLSLSFLSTSSFPRASMHYEYHIISFFSPCTTPQATLLVSPQQQAHFLTRLVFSSSLELFSPAPNIRISIVPHCLQSPEQNLFGFIGAQKMEWGQTRSYFGS